MHNIDRYIAGTARVGLQQSLRNKYIYKNQKLKRYLTLKYFMYLLLSENVPVKCIAAKYTTVFFAFFTNFKFTKSSVASL